MSPTRAYELIADFAEWNIIEDWDALREAARILIESGEAARAPGRMGRTCWGLVGDEYEDD